MIFNFIFSCCFSFYFSSYNAIKGYIKEGRQTELTATEHLVSAAQAGEFHSPRCSTVTQSASNCSQQPDNAALSWSQQTRGR